MGARSSFPSSSSSTGDNKKTTIKKYKGDDPHYLQSEKRFLLLLMAQKHDHNSLPHYLPTELIYHIMWYSSVRKPLYWEDLNGNSAMKITEDNQTCTNNQMGYRVQPFYSMEPLTHGVFALSYYIRDARPLTTVEIGVCLADIYPELILDNNDSCNTRVRNNPKAFLLSWNGGTGLLYGNSEGVLLEGYTVGERMILEINMNDRKLSFYKMLGDRNFSERRLIAYYNGLPDRVIPVCFLLGSGYDSSVTLMESLHSLL
jgi:hypothetical protein